MSPRCPLELQEDETATCSEQPSFLWSQITNGGLTLQGSQLGVESPVMNMIWDLTADILNFSSAEGSPN